MLLNKFHIEQIRKDKGGIKLVLALIANAWHGGVGTFLKKC